MENHPIPQDVTGFQFKLVGNMTVKQFAYVATGAILAVIFYYAPIPLIFKLIFIPLFGGTGAALAFLPIEGRPADMMLSSFIHDLFVPTQYLYHKQGGYLAISTVQAYRETPSKTETHPKKGHDLTQQKRTQQLAVLLSHTAKSGKTALDEKEDQFMESIVALSTNPQLLSAFQMEQTPQKHELSEEEKTRAKLASSPEEAEAELVKEAEAIKNELALAKQQEKELKMEHQPTEQVHNEVNKLQLELSDIEEQKQQLELELQKLKAQMQKPQPVEQPVTLPAPAQPSENVRSVPTDKASTVGLPAIPEDPNLILGIVKDPRGNVLPNILVEIKDKDGLPVRAFKTNGLGQFASATKLANGSYIIELEDPKGKHAFDTVAIEATGEILLPLEIISTDAREELRKELFS